LGLRLTWDARGGKPKGNIEKPGTCGGTDRVPGKDDRGEWREREGTVGGSPGTEQRVKKGEREKGSGKNMLQKMGVLGAISKQQERRKDK